jgi:hypothetical protein
MLIRKLDQQEKPKYLPGNSQTIEFELNQESKLIAIKNNHKMHVVRFDSIVSPVQRALWKVISIPRNTFLA